MSRHVCSCGVITTPRWLCMVVIPNVRTYLTSDIYKQSGKLVILVCRHMLKFLGADKKHTDTPVSGNEFTVPGQAVVYST